ncbi:MAG: class I SAM-dependent methyltransferase [Solirubrobacteraceae bacterium]
MLRSVRRKIVHQLFERRLGLDTEGELSREALGIENEEYGYYVPSSWLALPLALRWRPPTPQDVLLDVGSGKGRVALQASRYPFRRIVGLELVPELTKAARDNVRRSHDRLKCKDVTFITGDIRDFTIPSDVTMTYCCDPFRGTTFAIFLKRLRQLADTRGSPVLLIYSHPTEERQLLSTPGIELCKRFKPGLALEFPVHIYEVWPIAKTA